MKRFEYALRRKVEGEANQVLLSGSDEVPEQFRKLVDQYYRSLSKAPDKAAEKAPVRRSKGTGQEVRQIAAVTLCVLAAAALVHGQFQGLRGGGPRRIPARFATADSFDGGFSFCRLSYDQVRWEDGGQGWWTDYPDADINFSVRLSELTKTRISRRHGGEPNHLVVRATDDALFQCPFVEIEDAGTASFSDEEVGRLRAYLLKGGFLWSDDFWGAAALESFESELARVLPPLNTRLSTSARASDLPHHVPAQRIPQIPSIQHWRRTGGSTSERVDSQQVDFKGISDAHGRLMVLMTHNTDISDAWEREAEDPRFFYLFSPRLRGRHQRGDVCDDALRKVPGVRARLLDAQRIIRIYSTECF